MWELAINLLQGAVVLLAVGAFTLVAVVVSVVIIEAVKLIIKTIKGR